MITAYLNQAVNQGAWWKSVHRYSFATGAVPVPDMPDTVQFFYRTIIHQKRTSLMDCYDLFNNKIPDPRKSTICGDTLFCGAVRRPKKFNAPKQLSPPFAHRFITVHRAGVDVIPQFMRIFQYLKYSYCSCNRC